MTRTAPARPAPLATRATWAALAALALLAMLAALATAACDAGVEDAVCGDGVIEGGEDEASCCLDTGCRYGTCAGPDDGAPACVEAWQTACEASESGCVGAFRCDDERRDAPPAYDCDACDCPGADACYEGVCTDAATRDLERFDDVVDEALAMDEYPRFFVERAAAQPFALADAARAIADKLAADSRTTVLVAGADPAMDTGDLEAVLGVIVDAAGLTPSARLDLRQRPDDVCAQVQSAATAGLLPDAFAVAIVPDDGAARATCAYPGTFARCDVPMATDCALQRGRLAASVVVVDQVPALQELDGAVLRRAGLSNAELRDVFLQQALDAYSDARDVFLVQEGFRVGDRFAAAYFEEAAAGSVDADVLWVVLADPNARATKTLVYRVVWSDGFAQAFLVEHDVQVRDCAFDALDDDLGAGLVLMTCDNLGARLTATVDPASLTLIDLETSP